MKSGMSLAVLSLTVLLNSSQFTYIILLTNSLRFVFAQFTLLFRLLVLFLMRLSVCIILRTYGLDPSHANY